MSQDKNTPAPEARRTPAAWVSQLAVEVGFGIAFAVLLIAVAWASSNAIRFVYGGY